MNVFNLLKDFNHVIGWLFSSLVVYFIVSLFVELSFLIFFMIFFSVVVVDLFKHEVGLQ